MKNLDNECDVKLHFKTSYACNLHHYNFQCVNFQKLIKIFHGYQLYLERNPSSCIHSKAKYAITHHCAIPNIKEDMDDKKLILNATLQNNVIKVGT